MARMPGAIWKPLAANWASQPRMRAYDFFCIHTMVGTLAGTGTYFEKTNGVGYNGTESHFGVGPDGTIWQFQDTDFQADANGDGNWHVISSENADTGAPFPAWGGSDVPALTPQQVEANAEIAVWLYQTHGIPLGIAGSSKPGARGLAVHRYGVPGYMPAGAEQWSTSTGKACPGDRRIAQLPAISARAQQILNGDDMPLNADDLAAIRKAVLDVDLGDGVTLSSFVQLNSKIRDAKGKVSPIPNAVLDIDLGGGITLAKFANGTAGRPVDTGAVDPEVLAAALKDALGDQLAADVAARLTVSAKPAGS